MNTNYLTSVLRSYPSVSKYAKAVSAVLLYRVLTNDTALQKRIACLSRLPTSELKKAILDEYKKHEFALCNYKVVITLAQIDERDLYGSKIIENGKTPDIVRTVFQEAIMDSVTQPISYAQMKVIEDEYRES